MTKFRVHFGGNQHPLVVAEIPDDLFGHIQCDLHRQLPLLPDADGTGLGYQDLWALAAIFGRETKSKNDLPKNEKVP
jgi:hypothetical protein